MNYHIRFHPSVADDLDWIAEWISDYAGASRAAAKLTEIEQAIRSLAMTPHKGSRRDEIAQGFRVIPLGRKGIVVFVADDDLREVLIYGVSSWGGLSSAEQGSQLSECVVLSLMLLLWSGVG